MPRRGRGPPVAAGVGGGGVPSPTGLCVCVCVCVCHQRVGRSTCRVHPCKQEKKVMPGPVPQEVPYPALPRQSPLRCSPVPSGRTHRPLFHTFFYFLTA